MALQVTLSWVDEGGNERERGAHFNPEGVESLLEHFNSLAVEVTE